VAGSVQRAVGNWFVARPRNGWVERQDVVKACRGSAGAIGKAVQAMEAEGYLERRPDPKDGRRSLYRVRRAS